MLLDYYCKNHAAIYILLLLMLGFDKPQLFLYGLCVLEASLKDWVMYKYFKNIISKINAESYL